MEKSEFERVIEQLPIGACIINQDMTITFANPTFLGGLTIRQPDLVGQPLLTVFEEQARFLKRKIDSVFILKNPSFSYWQQRPHVFPMRSSRPITGDESQMYQNVQFMPLSNENAEVTHVSIFVTDVTAEASYFIQQSDLKNALEDEHQQLKALHQELKVAQKKMLQSEKMASIGQLAAGVAHEINNPIGFVSSNLETLKDYALKLIKTTQTQKKIIVKQAEDRFIKLLEDVYERQGVDFILEDLPELLDESLDGAERVKKIVNSLRDFALSDEESWMEVDLCAEIESTLIVLKNELKYKVQIEKQFPAEPVFLWGKASKIRQLLFNTILNSLQAMVSGGTLTIECKQEQDKIKLIIEDTGAGIAESDLERIFDPFFTTKEVGQGTGLGLSEVYTITEEHEASVDVLSKVGEGSRFVFVFNTPKSS
ncbi:PAS domain-containing sensor histidine kinase [Pseudoalteromonas sp. 13-15]|uniref:histidine kinase n=1 Tax=Pseudoalteromonas marina TaxID=267375 RepID=A0ABT9FAU4_9GAMM|nr:MULTISPECIES: ATP-binding protein [Pseudoalteromonas]AUL75350.1 PAS domain-containing sensor histidine kinase [Pseudoalteromonas sp. 13-15]MCK8121080.1 ATP-binding protein [Pseudoalteromonas sp. 2CM32C]MDP2563904.1 ATP-binding protein [Pseudoalteromonas marina]SIO23451.1 PAS fold [Pseudoalteromonas marina]